MKTKLMVYSPKFSKAIANPNENHYEAEIEFSKWLGTLTLKRKAKRNKDESKTTRS